MKLSPIVLRSNIVTPSVLQDLSNDNFIEIMKHVMKEQHRRTRRCIRCGRSNSLIKTPKECACSSEAEPKWVSVEPNLFEKLATEAMEELIKSLKEEVCNV